MILKLKRTPGIYLVGFMGSGKTTVGGGLAWELGWSFADIDEDIEAVQGISIAQIFETRGEGEFRRIEAAAIQERVRSIERGKPTVVALGGGAYVQEENASLIQENGITIWLDCPLDLLKQRIGDSSNRPLARDPASLEELYRLRAPLYARADFRIEITGDDAAETVSRILALPIF
ncbi:MAG: shikimate kinase [Acidobacteriota bacterium]|nr:shikimate kinase [Acidobacteriota bacterium]